MNIFLRELKANFKSLLIWGGIIVLISVIGFEKFSAYYENPELLAILEAMPQPLLDALNINAFNLTTVTGFWGILYEYFALLLSIAAVMWGSDIIAKEERDKTIEFSLTLPVKRGQMITAKTLAAAVNSTALLLIAAGITLILSANYNPDREFYNFFQISLLAIFIQQMIFLSIGIFLGCVARQHKKAGAFATSVLLITYFLSIVSKLDNRLDFLKFFSPFNYFDPIKLLHETKMDTPFVLLSLAIITFSLAGAYLTYAKKDLYI